MSLWKRILQSIRGGDGATEADSPLQIQRRAFSPELIADKVARYGGDPPGPGLRRWLEALLNEMSPVANAAIANDVFRRLGISNANVYRDATSPHDNLCSSARNSPLSAVHVWLLTLDQANTKYDSVYAHLEGDIGIGFLICKLEAGSFRGAYTVGNALKSKLGL